MGLDTENEDSESSDLLRGLAVLKGGKKGGTSTGKKIK